MGEVEFRPGHGSRARLIRRGSAALAIAVVLFAAAAVRSPALEWIAVVPLLYAAASFTAYLAQGRMLTRLTPQGIEVHRHGTTVVAWEDIRAIEVVSHEKVADVPVVNGRAAAVDRSGTVVSAARRNRAPRQVAAVQVVRTTGRPVTLPAPLVTADQDDPGFEDKVQSIRAQWQQATGRSG